MDDPDFDPDRTQFKFDPGDKEGDEVESPVRAQSIEEPLAENVEPLEEYPPELLTELHTVVCEEGEGG